MGAVPNQVKTREALTAPAVSQMGLPSSSVPICRTGTTNQRKTCGTLSLGRKVTGTMYLVSLTYSSSLRP